MKSDLPETVTVKELLKKYPHLLHTFIDLGLNCAGCPADAFHTIADVAKEYGIDKDGLLDRLQSDIEPAEKADETTPESTP